MRFYFLQPVFFKAKNAKQPELVEEQHNVEAQYREPQSGILSKERLEESMGMSRTTEGATVCKLLRYSAGPQAYIEFFSTHAADEIIKALADYLDNLK